MSSFHTTNDVFRIVLRVVVVAVFVTLSSYQQYTGNRGQFGLILVQAFQTTPAPVYTTTSTRGYQTIRRPINTVVTGTTSSTSCTITSTSCLSTKNTSPLRTSTLVALSSSSSKNNNHDSKNAEEVEEYGIDMDDVGFVLLAGGKGSRMKASIPKQFLELNGCPILHYSLDLLLNQLPQFLQQKGYQFSSYVILVMDPIYQTEYQSIVDQYPNQLYFAHPGIERQGSVANGLNKLIEISSLLYTQQKEKKQSNNNNINLSKGSCHYVAIHDSARPLVTIPEICHVVRDAKKIGAAVLGVPCKATIKESEDGLMVLRTIPRSRLWEVHTPQVIRIDTLIKGFEKVTKENLEVTDDVSIVEALGEPVQLTLGQYTNLKITTPEDLDVATAILEERKCIPINLLKSKRGN